MLKKLPLDIQTFRELRESDYIYVDKTEYAYNLITGGRRYFLSRPRRFGKSLFISTLKEIFSGSKELFEDLWIGKSDYQWKKYAVISLSLSAVNSQDSSTLNKGLCRELGFIAKQYAVTLETGDDDSQGMFVELIRLLHDKFGRVAILIDEYDYPILKHLNNNDMAVAIREVLRTFFAVIKDLDAFISFVFLTGVSSFSKAGIFSGLNNLQILTLDDANGAILGYTDQEIDFYFKKYITVWAQKEQMGYSDLRMQIKEWYNGYRFGNEVLSVYNPFSFMNAVNKQEFRNFWFQSGTPTFLIEELTKEYRKKECEIFDVDNIGEVTELTLCSFDVGLTPLVTLMFQTGYLTIACYNRKNQAYTLQYPNLEVRTTLHKYLLAALIESDITIVDNVSLRLRAAFEVGNLDAVIDAFKRLFSKLPYYLHDDQEKYYHGIVHVICDAAGLQTQSEYLTSHGRIDLVIDMPATLYIFEVKLNESAENALAQIEKNKYYQPFVDCGKPIEMVGIAFKREPKKFEITYVSKMLEN